MQRQLGENGCMAQTSEQESWIQKEINLKMYGKWEDGYFQIVQLIMSMYTPCLNYTGLFFK